MNTMTNQSVIDRLKAEQVSNLSNEVFNFRKVTKGGKLVPFRVTQDSEGKEIVIEKRPDFEAKLPYVDGSYVKEQLNNPELTEDEANKVLKYISDLHNANVKSEAQKQINEVIKDNAGIDLEQSMLNLIELTFWSLVFKEPADRKMFSEQLISEAQADFLKVGREHFKRANGTQVPDANILNASKEIFVDRFKNTKSDKAVLELLQGYIATWFDNSSNQTQFIDLASYLAERIELYMNKEEESKLGKFE